MTALDGSRNTSAPFGTSASLAYIALLPYLESATSESSLDATKEYTPTPANAPPFSEIHRIRLTSVVVGKPPAASADAPGFTAGEGAAASPASSNATDDDAISASVARTTRATRMVALLRAPAILLVSID